MGFRGMSRDSLAYILRNGGGLDFDVAGFSKDDLAYIARNAVNTGAKIIMRNTAGLSADDLAYIARNATGLVTFAG